MSTPALSLVIAVYRRPDALEKIFTALCVQTYEDFEVVVADDGSPAEISDLVTSWQGKFAYPIRHVWHEDAGFRKTIIINAAVVGSLGEYLVFIDGDCIPHHRFLQDHMDRREEGAVLAGRRVMMDEQATSRCTIESVLRGSHEAAFQWLIHNEKHTAQYAFRIPGIDPIRNCRRDNYFILGSNFSMYRQDFAALNGYDERIVGRGMEDNNLHARVLAAHMPIRSISQVALQYHLFHRADPIPHDDATVKAFCTVDSGWTVFGIVKKDSICA